MSSDKRGRPEAGQGVEAADEELSQLLARARSLSRDAQPERDLWPQVARRIADPADVPARGRAGENSEGAVPVIAMQTVTEQQNHGVE